MIGETFHDLTVIAEAGRCAYKRPLFRCICVCGKETIVGKFSLKYGNTKSCGCRRGGQSTHGESRTVLYAIWRGIINRCENSNVEHFSVYGGAGITISPEWRNDYEAFRDYIGLRPSPKHSVDRIDGTRGYEPGNVRWATPTEQANNKIRTRYVTYRGVEMALNDAVRAAGSVIHYEAAAGRIRGGWTVERAVETPRLHVSGNSKERRAANVSDLV